LAETSVVKSRPSVPYWANLLIFWGLHILLKVEYSLWQWTISNLGSVASDLLRCCLVCIVLVNIYQLYTLVLSIA